MKFSNYILLFALIAVNFAIFESNAFLRQTTRPGSAAATQYATRGSSAFIKSPAKYSGAPLKGSSGFIPTSCPAGTSSLKGHEAYRGYNRAAKAVAAAPFVVGGGAYVLRKSSQPGEKVAEEGDIVKWQQEYKELAKKNKEEEIIQAARKRLEESQKLEKERQELERQRLAELEKIKKARVELKAARRAGKEAQATRAAEQALENITVELEKLNSIISENTATIAQAKQGEEKLITEEKQLLNRFKTIFNDYIGKYVGKFTYPEKLAKSRAELQEQQRRVEESQEAAEELRSSVAPRYKELKAEEAAKKGALLKASQF